MPMENSRIVVSLDFGSDLDYPANGEPMTKKARDFYHVQDRLALAWSYATFGQDPFSPKILSLSREIEEALDIIKPIPPMLAPFIELTRKKISLLEDALAKSRLVEGESSESQEASIDEEEVSLSSSGMGFFTKLH